MKQVLLEKGAVTLHDVPAPHVGSHEVLVVVYYAFIDSGSHHTIEDAGVDTTFMDTLKRAFDAVSATTRGRQRTLSRTQSHHALHVLGASCAGQVIAVGSHVQHVAVGDWVACASAEYAVHAELVSVPEHLVAVLQSKAYIRSASIGAIGARALHALRQSQAQFGEWVAVVGLGLLGQLIVQLARLQGCRVIAIDVIESRRHIAKQLGADRVYDAEDPYVVQHIVRMTHNSGVDATIIAAHSNSDSVINQAAMMTRKRGSLVVASRINMTCDRQIMADKELHLICATSYGPGRCNPDYEQHSIDYPYTYVRWTAQRNLQAFIDALERGCFHIDPIVTHEYELHEVDAAYRQAIRKTTVGIVLTYRHEETTCAQPRNTVSLLSNKRREQEALRVGVLGISANTAQRLLPTLSQVRDLHIATLVDTDNAYVYQTGRQYDADYVSTDPSDVLSAGYVGAIAINDPAYMHDAYIFHQLEDGVGVFINRIPHLNAHELYKWRMYMQRYAQAPLCLNLHRSFSSHIQDMASMCHERTIPMICHYRVIRSMGISSDDLIHDIAHAVDVCMTLTQSSIRSFSVLPIHATQYGPDRKAGCIVHLICSDGSTLSLTLMTCGSPHAGQEYLHVHSDGTTLTLQDNTWLRTYGLYRSYDHAYYDDGYTTLIHRFFGEYGYMHCAPPIPFSRIVTVMEITMNVYSHILTSSQHTGSCTSTYTVLQQ